MVKNNSTILNENNKLNDDIKKKIIDNNQNNNIVNKNNLLIKNQIQKILGNNFNCRFVDNNFYCFEFTNETKISNQNKSKYIKEKINELKLNNFLEIEDLKLSKIGRFVVIVVKTIEDYLEEKKIIFNEYVEKNNLIDLKIDSLKQIMKNINN